LWLQRGAIVVSNPQINTLTAHSDNKFLAILTNQDTRPQTANISLSEQALGIDLKTIKSVTVRSVDGARQVGLKEGMAELKFKPRELLVVEVEGARIEIAAHRAPAEPVQGNIPTEVETRAGEVTVKAVAIAVAPGPWDAFIWCTAADGQAKSVTLGTNVDGTWKSQADNDYPFEFNIPMASSEETLQFRIVWESPSGEKFHTGDLTLRTAGLTAPRYDE
jgi:hypothetical protein